MTGGGLSTVTRLYRLQCKTIAFRHVYASH
jgi:hypothetical protein